jgi:hypothetical protein
MSIHHGVVLGSIEARQTHSRATEDYSGMIWRLTLTQVCGVYEAWEVYTRAGRFTQKL